MDVKDEPLTATEIQRREKKYWKNYAKNNPPKTDPFLEKVIDTMTEILKKHGIL